ncbi:MAG: hypothetical protein H5U40_13320, partial [Polyangiaceae bacterium]|nr:hypothetical protein [Polyangiaceae bacterium]
MSLFRRLLGRETPIELESRADALFASGEFGEAKLAFDRLLERFPEGSDDRARISARIGEARDGIARQRLAEAARLARMSEPDLARTE